MFCEPENVDEYSLQRKDAELLLYGTLLQALLAGIHTHDLGNDDSTIAFNLLFQFLFFELRNTYSLRKWIHRKLSMELDELVSKTTTGKLFDKLSVT